MKWILDRVKEPTTWVGIVGFATALGLSISPELSAAIVQMGVAAASLVLVVLKERKD